MIGTQNNVGTSLDSAGVRILDSGYNNVLRVLKKHPFFGGWRKPVTGEQFLEISYPLTTSEKTARKLAFDQVQDRLIGITENGQRIEIEDFPKRPLPKQGRKPVF